ncbi:hypothetical protein D3C87_1094890 [compost metagenome]
MHEAFGRQVGAVEITAGQADATNINLASGANRDRTHMTVQNIDLSIRQWPTNQHAFISIGDYERSRIPRDFRAAI